MASRAVNEARIRYCYQQLLNAKPTSRLVAELADKEGISRRQARNIVAKAYAQLAADWTEHPISNEAYLSKMIAACEQVIEQGLRDGHGHWVLGAINSLSRLTGIGADQKRPNPYGQHRHHG